MRQLEEQRRRGIHDSLTQRQQPQQSRPAASAQTGASRTQQHQEDKLWMCRLMMPRPSLAHRDTRRAAKLAGFVNRSVHSRHVGAYQGDMDHLNSVGKGTTSLFFQCQRASALPSEQHARSLRPRHPFRNFVRGKLPYSIRHCVGCRRCRSAHVAIVGFEGLVAYTGHAVDCVGGQATVRSARNPMSPQALLRRRRSRPACQTQGWASAQRSLPKILPRPRCRRPSPTQGKPSITGKAAAARERVAGSVCRARASLTGLRRRRLAHRARTRVSPLVACSHVHRFSKYRCGRRTGTL